MQNPLEGAKMKEPRNSGTQNFPGGRSVTAKEDVAKGLGLNP